MTIIPFRDVSRTAKADVNDQLRPQHSDSAATLVVPRGRDPLLSDPNLPLCSTFYPLGYVVDIMTNDAAVLRAAHESFGHRNACRTSPIPPIRIGVYPGASTARPADPTGRQYNHLYSLVADGENQALLDLRTCVSFVWVTQAAVRNGLYLRYNFIEKVVYLLLGASVVTDIHAACVTKNGRGILLCGDSGAGKSTLAYACARAGWTYTSDDTSYLINDSASPRVIGHAHRARFRPPARDLFPELQERELSPRLDGKPSIEVPMAELPVRSTAAEASVHAVVFLKRYPGATARMVPLPRRTATEWLTGQLYSSGEVRARHAGILENLADVPASELHYCDLDEGMNVLEALTLTI